MMALLTMALAIPAQDTARPRQLDPIVVTAERSPVSLSAIPAAVTRLSARELGRLPHATLADLLRLAPGFAVVSFDGLGFDPGVMVRGFYGGGEAEYVQVQVDGRPVNLVMTGVVAWDALPTLASIEAIEIVRGGASSLHGDAAIGGVINVLTRERTAARQFGIGGSAGSHGTVRVDGGLNTTDGIRFGGAIHRTDGFRAHAERTTGQVRLDLPLSRTTDRPSLGLQGHWRELDDPGPLLESLAEQDRRASDALFQFDHTADRGIGAGLDLPRHFGSRWRGAGRASVDWRRIEAVRTVALAPGFGDTQERVATTIRSALGGQLEGHWPDADLVAGIEAEHHALDSRWYDVTAGTRDDYDAAAGTRGALRSDGHTTRLVTAGFAQIGYRLRPWLRMTAGMRFDRLDDSDRDCCQPDEADATHTRLSPRAGLTLRYHEGRRGDGSAYLAWSSSFKAPTLDQKYDRRRIVIPFPPFELRGSNPALEPQQGQTLEAGVTHWLALGSGSAQATASVYHTAMHDEIDFDVEQLSYRNIGRSRHRGLEAGIRLEGARLSAQASYTLQDAVARSGDHEGMRLKAIPRHAAQAGLTVRPFRARAVEGSASVTHLAGMFFDDANTRPIPDYTRVDARLTIGIARHTLLLDARNLLGARYSSTGFLDPAGSGEAYLYPAAERVIEIGLRSRW